MKYIAAVISVILIICVSAGCIDEIEDLNDPILGTWVSGEYTNLAGTHYVKMVETFSLNHSISETLYPEDGEPVQMSAVWKKSGDNIYHSYYAPIVFDLNPSTNQAIINSDLFIAKNILMEHTVSDNGIVGVWENSYPEEILSGIYYVNFDLKKDGTGTVNYIEKDRATNGSSVLTWLKMDENQYAVIVSDTVVWEIKSDGNLYDNFGAVYVKE